MRGMARLEVKEEVVEETDDRKITVSVEKYRNFIYNSRLHPKLPATHRALQASHAPLQPRPASLAISLNSASFRRPKHDADFAII
jgi:hypothetical protein